MAGKLGAAVGPSTTPQKSPLITVWVYRSALAQSILFGGLFILSLTLMTRADNWSLALFLMACGALLSACLCLSTLRRYKRLDAVAVCWPVPGDASSFAKARFWFRVRNESVALLLGALVVGSGFLFPAFAAFWTGYWIVGLPVSLWATHTVRRYELKSGRRVLSYSHPRTLIAELSTSTLIAELSSSEQQSVYSALAHDGQWPEVIPAETRSEIAVGAARDLHYAGRFAESGEASTYVWEATKQPFAIFNVACSRARAGDAPGAMQALATAIDCGFPKEDAARDSDLTALHELSTYRSLIATE
jgi:hypothetical protein